MSLLTNMRDDAYKGAVATASKTLITTQPFQLWDAMEAAMHAMNACGTYVNKGFLRRQYTPDGRETIVVVTRVAIKQLPAVEDLLMWVTAESAIEFLSKTSGIGVVANSWTECPF